MSQQFFAGASIGTINGGTFVSGTASTLDRLSAAVAHSALHDAPARNDKTRCHPHTRTDVLDRLERWAQGICDEGASVLWLHGSAGDGKSAIMQSLAERCAGHGLVLASFFFFRTDATRNTAEVLIPTLVYQIFLCFPSEIHFLDSILDRDPGVFRKSFDVQLRDVFLPVLRHLVQLGSISRTPDSPRVFLIDGLDECDNISHQQLIIRAAEAVCFEHGIPVKFLIASRPELAISTAFRPFKRKNRVLASISLDDESSSADIRLYLEAEFAKIRAEHPFAYMIPPNWPEKDDIETLDWKASSQFIFAATVTDYIRATQESPVRSLQVILGLEVPRTNTPSPFAALDALYRHILERAAHRNEVLEILRYLLFIPGLFTLNSTRALCTIRGHSLDEFYVFMADMVPVMRVPNNPDGGAWFRHKSLEDFLNDPSRSGPLFINKAAYLASHLERYFCLLEHYKASYIGTSSPEGLLVRDTIACSDLHQLICSAILASGSFSTTQELVRKYDLRYVSSCVQYGWQYHGDYTRYPYAERVVEHFHAVYSIRKFIGRDFLYQWQCFMDIVEESFLESCRGSPLGQVLMPYIHSRYPARYATMLTDKYPDSVAHGLLMYRTGPNLERQRTDGEYWGSRLTTPHWRSIPMADVALLRDHQSLVSTDRVTNACESIMQCLIARQRGTCLGNTHGVFCCGKSTTQARHPHGYDLIRERNVFGYMSSGGREYCSKLEAMLDLVTILLDIMTIVGFSKQLLDRENWQALLEIPRCRYYGVIYPPVPVQECLDE